MTEALMTFVSYITLPSSAPIQSKVAQEMELDECSVLLQEGIDDLCDFVIDSSYHGTKWKVH